MYLMPVDRRPDRADFQSHEAFWLRLNRSICNEIHPHVVNVTRYWATLEKPVWRLYPYPLQYARAVLGEAIFGDTNEAEALLLAQFIIRSLRYYLVSSPFLPLDAPNDIPSFPTD